MPAISFRILREKDFENKKAAVTPRFRCGIPPIGEGALCQAPDIPVFPAKSLYSQY